MKKKLFCLFLTLVMVVGMMGIFTSCDDGDGGNPCAEGHVNTDGDGKCDVCQKTINHNCADDDDDSLCDFCSKDLSALVGPGGEGPGGEGPGDDPFADPGVDDSYGPVAWVDEAPKTIKFQMTHYDSNGTTPSACYRYLAGEDPDGVGTIDDNVKSRNDAAERIVNVNVVYHYYDNVDDNGWGKLANKIAELVKSKDPETPDIFCTYTYDMVCTSLKGSFNNLKNTKLDTNNGGNYFEFVKEGYNEWEDNKGYMNEYMGSLTLSRTKMYVLASDYFLDCIRAFFVVPVHVGLLESVGPKIHGDLDGDGIYTIDDFYEIVWQRKWTYSMAAMYSAAVYKNTGTSNHGEDLKDILGYVVTSSAGGSAHLYTTNITIVSRVYDESTDEYTYSYPEEGKPLYDVFDAINKFMDRTGVTYISSEDPAVAEYANGVTGSGAADVAVRTRFCAGNILFGNQVILGSLEHDSYQTLKDSGGFGVLPVPLYHEIPEGSDETYLTTTHNCARPGAIASSTKNFAACTAFLDYVSTHSAHILEEYYNYKLQYDVVDAEIEGNVEMLKYLRLNVRSAFDKTWEDTIAEYFKVSEHKWSMCLEGNAFQYDVRKTYEEYRGAKDSYLQTLFVKYDELP